MDHLPGSFAEGQRPSGNTSQTRGSTGKQNRPRCWPGGTGHSFRVVEGSGECPWGRPAASPRNTLCPEPGEADCCQGCVRGAALGAQPVCVLLILIPRAFGQDHCEFV